MNYLRYSIRWTQPYSLDYWPICVYNTQEQLIETQLAASPMLEAAAVINRINQF